MDKHVYTYTHIYVYMYMFTCIHMYIINNLKCPLGFSLRRKEVSKSETDVGPLT